MPKDRYPNRLRELRNAAGLSAEALGSRAHMSGPTVTRLETGALRLKLDQAERLAKALGCQVTDIMPGEGRLEAAHIKPWPRTAAARCAEGAPDIQALMARRLKAALQAYTNDFDLTAGKLGVHPEDLREYVDGIRPLDDAFLTRFAAVTRCPLAWIFLGKITDQMPAWMAARIALSDPELVEAALPPEADRREVAEQKTDSRSA